MHEKQSMQLCLSSKVNTEIKKFKSSETALPSTPVPAQDFKMLKATPSPWLKPGESMYEYITNLKNKIIQINVPVWITKMQTIKPRQVIAGYGKWNKWKNCPN